MKHKKQAAERESENQKKTKKPYWIFGKKIMVRIGTVTEPAEKKQLWTGQIIPAAIKLWK